MDEKLRASKRRQGVTLKLGSMDGRIRARKRRQGVTLKVGSMGGRGTDALFESIRALGRLPRERTAPESLPQNPPPESTPRVHPESPTTVVDQEP